jgi:hypothetical protein
MHRPKPGRLTPQRARVVVHSPCPSEGIAHLQFPQVVAAVSEDGAYSRTADDRAWHLRPLRAK